MEAEPGIYRIGINTFSVAPDFYFSNFVRCATYSLLVTHFVPGRQSLNMHELYIL